MDLPVIAVIFGAGMFWTGITFWAVRVLLSRQSEWFTTEMGRVATRATLMESINREHTVDLHRLDMEVLKLRGELSVDFRDSFVGRREFDEMKGWLKEMRDKINTMAERAK